MFNLCDSIWLATSSAYVNKKEADGTMIELFIDPQTVPVADIVFGFTNFSAVGKIPSEVYRKVELLLKDKLRFNVTAAGKKVNYIYMMYD